MAKAIETDLAVIGAGPAGLSVAAGAAQLGAAVVLCESGRMGGDCLNVGCVPSKALLAAARTAQTVRDAARFGVNGHEPFVTYGRVHAHIHEVIASIAPHDSVERFNGLGVRVIQAPARFLGKRDLDVGGTLVRARRIVVATGSRPYLPPIPGLAEVAPLTNETVFALTDLPEHLIVIGGGPIGVELAQAFRRLGSAVTLLERATILAKDDPEAVAVLRGRLLSESVALHEGVAIERVAPAGNGVAVTLGGGDHAPIIGSHLLVATGRRPNVEGLALEQAGIAVGRLGIEVDRRLRTTNPHVYAIGDVTGLLPFTHVAAHHAGIVVRNALFRWPATVETRALPRITYSDPELAQVGPTEAEARAAGETFATASWTFQANDRARAERRALGFVKLLVNRRNRPLAATIVGPDAGELAHLWVLAIGQKIPLARIAQMVAPYPTLGEAGKSAAGAYFAPRLFSPMTKRLVRLLARFG